MKREICVEKLDDSRDRCRRRRRRSHGVEWSAGVAVINGGQCGVVIWQILRKFTAAVTTGGRYLSPHLNGNDRGMGSPSLSDWK